MTTALHDQLQRIADGQSDDPLFDNYRLATAMQGVLDICSKFADQPEPGNRDMRLIGSSLKTVATEIYQVATDALAAEVPEPVEASQQATTHRYPQTVVNAVTDVLTEDLPTAKINESHAHSVLSAIHDASTIRTTHQVEQLPPETYVKTNRGTLRWAEYVDDLDLPATVVDWGVQR